MEPCDLTLTEHQQTDTPPPTTAMSTVSLPVEDLEQILGLVPRGPPRHAARYLPAAPAHAAAGIYTDEAYMAPVHDLVRPEETLDFLRAQYERTALTPVPLHQLLVVGADSPSERPGCAGAGRAQGRTLPLHQ